MLQAAQLRHRFQVCLPAYALWVLTYEAVGSYASRLPGVNLTTTIDELIPFRPGWIWVYVFTYVVPVAALLVVRDDQRVYRALLAVGLASLSAYLVFIYFPVKLPPPPLGTGLNDQLVALAQSVDHPANQLPSLHVANAWILYATVAGERRERWFRASAAALAFAITLSTLFVKAHVVLDVVTGAVWGPTAYWAAGQLHERLRSSRGFATPIG
jgi:membrane-associated phospholipid phosphatase